MNVALRKIGLHRGAKRLWLEGRIPVSAGFVPGVKFRATVTKVGYRLTLSLCEDGDRVVSGKRKGERELPVIDLNSNAILAMFDGMEQVRVVSGNRVIHIIPVASAARAKLRLERIRKKLMSGEPISVGSLSHGGGVLSLATHAGLNEAGVSNRMAFACDIDGDMLEHAADRNPAWNPGTALLNLPLQELAFDPWVMDHLPEIDYLEGGLPCNGASVAGRAKNGTACAEAHEDVGHLVAAFLAIVAKTNPAVIELENVVPYQSSASMWIIRHQLRDLGYTVHEAVLDGGEWGALEHRKRMCMVAVTNGMLFDFSAVRPEPVQPPILGDVLEPVPLDSPCWRSMDYLKDKEVRDKAAGKGFAMQVVTPQSAKVGTIGEGYAKNRSTEPKVQHPENPDLLRLLTPSEHARVKQIPERLIDGLSSTRAHSLLGQSIIFAPFVAVAKAVGEMLTSWAFEPLGAVDA